MSTSICRKSYTYIFQFLYFYHFQRPQAGGPQQVAEFIDIFNSTLSVHSGLETSELQLAKKDIISILENWNKLVTIIAPTLKKNNFASLSPIEQVLLCLGAFEILIRQDARPRALVINEIVELGKKYASKSSSSLINGVLDNIDNIDNISN